MLAEENLKTWSKNRIGLVGDYKSITFYIEIYLVATFHDGSYHLAKRTKERSVVAQTRIQQ